MRRRPQNWPIRSMARPCVTAFTGKADQIRALQQEGYAPLMRFGQYIVDVAKFDENGEPVGSAMTEILIVRSSACSRQRPRP